MTWLYIRVSGDSGVVSVKKAHANERAPFPPAWGPVIVRFEFSLTQSEWVSVDRGPGIRDKGWMRRETI